MREEKPVFPFNAERQAMSLVCLGRGLNPRPTALEADALPLGFRGGFNCKMPQQPEFLSDWDKNNIIRSSCLQMLYVVRISFMASKMLFENVDDARRTDSGCLPIL